MPSASAVACVCVCADVCSTCVRALACVCMDETEEWGSCVSSDHQKDSIEIVMLHCDFPMCGGITCTMPPVDIKAIIGGAL